MATLTIRIPEEKHERLKALAEGLRILRLQLARSFAPYDGAGSLVNFNLVGRRGV
ncbi:toxin-antitoxin system HicB family antitoxin [Euhalothece natronophila]|uniref:toxin-antitoxin system HicB family antitoxin n=1 Tax=Euhalothece natronophila TaxID=577489 RepID=UPI0016491D21|nr:toxin-antitoxin system HicB family antitoxin [Euhalothece natronophila]